MGSARSVARKALLEPMPMRFTIDIASTIVIVNGRTRSPRRYITLPSLLDADENRFQVFGALDLGKALGHGFHHSVLREAAKKRIFGPAHDRSARDRAGNKAGRD